MNSTKIYLKIKCKICDNEFNSFKSLSNHISRKHKEINKEEYYLNNIGQKGVCPVCLEDTEFLDLTKGYRTLCNKRSCNVAYTNPMKLSSYLYHGYSLDEAKQKLSEYQSNQTKKVNRTEEYFDKCFKNRVGYWKNKGFTDDESKNIISKNQNHTSLDFFIKKYGYIYGKIKYEERLEKYKNTWNQHSIEEKEKINKTKGRSFSDLINEYGLEKAKDIISKRFYKNGVISTLEKEITEELSKNFKFKKQLKLVNYDNKFKYYDLSIDNIIIEINGSYWHADPRFYKADEIVYRGLTAKEIWNKDLEKKKLAEENNYYLIYIWEEDFRKNKEKTLEETIRKIYAFKNN